MSVRTHNTLVILGVTLFIIIVGGNLTGLLVFDSAGYNKAHIRLMSLPKQHELLEQRLSQLDSIVSEITTGISERRQKVGEDDWERFDRGGMRSASHGLDRRRGLTVHGSYYLNATVRLNLPGTGGELSDAQAASDFFTDRGWLNSIYTDTFFLTQGLEEYTVLAVTDEGWYVKFGVLKNRNAMLEVSSGAFWGEWVELHKIRDRKGLS